MAEVTIFEKILKREIPANIVFENAQVLAFKDIHPQAAMHIVFIHKQKSKDISELMESSPQQIQEIFLAIHLFTKMQGLENSGFRILTNKGLDGGQSVFYTHFHLLAGEKLGGFGK